MFAPVVCHLTVYRRLTGPETYPVVAKITSLKATSPCPSANGVNIGCPAELNVT